MLKIVYCKDGIPISDFKVYETVDRMIDTYLTARHSRSVYIGTTTTVVPIYNYEYRTSSELCLSVFSLRVLEEKIPINEIEFYLEDEKLEFDKYKGLKIANGKQLGFLGEVTRQAVKIGIEKLIRDKKS